MKLKFALFFKKKEYLQSLKEWINPAEKFQELLKEIKDDYVIQSKVCKMSCEVFQNTYFNVNLGETKICFVFRKRNYPLKNG